MMEQLLRRKGEAVHQNLKILKRQRKEPNLQLKNLLPRKKMARHLQRGGEDDRKREQLLPNQRPRQVLARAEDDPRKRKRRNLLMKKKKRTRMLVMRKMAMSKPTSDP